MQWSGVSPLELGEQSTGLWKNQELARFLFDQLFSLVSLLKIIFSCPLHSPSSKRKRRRYFLSFPSLHYFSSIIKPKLWEGVCPSPCSKSRLTGWRNGALHFHSCWRPQPPLTKHLGMWLSEKCRDKDREGERQREGGFVVFFFLKTSFFNYLMMQYCSEESHSRSQRQNRQKSRWKPKTRPWKLGSQTVRKGTWKWETEHQACVLWKKVLAPRRLRY